MKPNQAKAKLADWGVTLAKQIRRSDQEPDKWAADTFASIHELRRFIIKLQSTSGLVLRKIEKDKALDKLAEVDLWSGENKACACRRLHECIMWATQGIQE